MKTSDSVQEKSELIDLSCENNTNIMCIEYPGVVENDDNAIKTLGGLDNINKTFSAPSKRLEMKWRPQDVYCKGMFADRLNTTNLLLKVKRKRRKKINNDMPGTSSFVDEPDDKLEAEVVGTIKTTYRFQGMVDFQYLAAKKQEDGSFKDLSKDVIITGLTESKEFLKKDTPLMIVPTLFSRLDLPTDYMYRPGPQHRAEYANPDDSLPKHLIGSARQKRSHYTIFANFSDKTIPAKAQEGADTVLIQKIRDISLLDKVKQRFDERPIWSRNAIMCNLKVPLMVLKYILPLVAYYHVTGPWRCLWVRLGYDPRKDKDSKIYQLLDFRIRQRDACDAVAVQSKRSTYSYILPNAQVKPTSQVVSILPSELDTYKDSQAKTNTTGTANEFRDSTFEFRPGVIPPYRQMFYQMCDIHEDEIQSLVHANDDREENCTERDGWCIDSIQDRCRAIINRHMTKMGVRTDCPQLDLVTRRRRRRRSWEVSDDSEDDEQQNITEQLAEMDDDEDDDDDDDENTAGDEIDASQDELEGGNEVDPEENAMAMEILDCP